MNSKRVLAGNDAGTTTTNGVLAMPAIGAMSRMKLKLRFGESVALTALVETGIRIVYPSAGEVTTYSVATLPPKPGWSRSRIAGLGSPTAIAPQASRNVGRAAGWNVTIKYTGFAG